MLLFINYGSLQIWVGFYHFLKNLLITLLWELLIFQLLMESVDSSINGFSPLKMELSVYKLLSQNKFQEIVDLLQ